MYVSIDRHTVSIYMLIYGTRQNKSFVRVLGIGSRTFPSYLARTRPALRGMFGNCGSRKLGCRLCPGGPLCRDLALTVRTNSLTAQESIIGFLDVNSVWLEHYALQEVSKDAFAHAGLPTISELVC